MKILMHLLLIISISLPLWSAGQSGSMEQIEGLLEKEAKSFEHGGFSFALAEDSKLLISKGYGWADKESQILMSGTSPTAAASVTKLFTATAIMQLAEDNIVDLDAPINQYIKDFSLADGREEGVTLRRMLTHYSPLPSDYLKGYIQPYVSEEQVHDYINDFLSQLNNENSASPADFVYRYSNTAYELAAYIVYKQTGIPYPAYVRHNILNPLGMNDSGYPYRGAKVPELIKGYDENGEAPLVPMRGTGEGDIISTVEDLIHFGNLFLSDSDSSILKQSTIEEMLTKQNENAKYDFDLYRGLGWYRDEVPGYPGHHYYYHEGGTHPFSSLLVIIPELNKTFALLANEGEHSFDSLSVGIIQSLFEEKTGQKPQKPGGERSPAIAERYHGVYSTELGIMEISDSLTGPVLTMMGMKLHITRKRGGFYGVQLRLLGLLPLPIADLKSISFQFQEEDFISFGIYTDGKYRGLGTQVEEKSISSSWTSRTGEYEIVNNDETNFLTSFKLVLDDGSQQPMITVSVSTIPGEMSFPIDLSEEGFATIEGYGRHMGDIIPLINRGDEELLLYSGYYLKKK